MKSIDDRIEAYDNRLLNDYLASNEEWDYYVSWAEEEGLDTESDDSWEAWKAYCDQMAEDAAVDRYESKMMDDYYDYKHGV
jgi:hypothetical protein